MKKPVVRFVYLQEGALDMLQELKNIKMSLETLQSTRVGMSVNAVRKLSSDEDVQTLAKTLIKSWKKLLDGSEGKSEEEKKKKDGSPLSMKKSGEIPTTPTSPNAPALPSQVTSFPPAPVTADSVRNKCRELLVAALQTDDDHKTIGVDCEHLAAQIEEHILSCWRHIRISTDMKYKTRLRSRISNLKDQRIPTCGATSCAGTSRLNASWRPAELKQIREALTKESIREHQLSKVGGTETDMFVCSACHGKSCTYTQVQTRSADEPMTTFVYCNSCGNRWKLLVNLFCSS
uniref:Transcription elongation factor A (SII), 2 n=1 Tax=Echeneis naucrates TaxID=173247 RepID=A0A665VNL4_ECHNA